MSFIRSFGIWLSDWRNKPRVFFVGAFLCAFLFHLLFVCSFIRVAVFVVEAFCCQNKKIEDAVASSAIYRNWTIESHKATKMLARVWMWFYFCPHSARMFSWSFSFTHFISVVLLPINFCSFIWVKKQTDRNFSVTFICNYSMFSYSIFKSKYCPSMNSRICFIISSPLLLRRVCDCVCRVCELCLHVDLFTMSNMNILISTAKGPVLCVCKSFFCVCAATK